MANKGTDTVGQTTSRGLSRGTNQTGVRLYNERLVLSMIRRAAELPKADIARATNLSPQTISIIINHLTRDGLLLRGDPVRGRIGQPSVPYSLNPKGAYAFGLKIGRRSTDLYLINFTGEILQLARETYAYPTPKGVLAFAERSIARLTADLSPDITERIVGLGIAAPYDMWKWPDEIGAPMQDIRAWETVDVSVEVAKLCPWPIYFSNDITAACAAELMFGRGSEHDDYLYVYIGTFMGGGLVLDGHLFPGKSKNSAALGSIPHRDKDGNLHQLMNVASIYVLEKNLAETGKNTDVLWQSPEDWGDLGEPLEEWMSEVANSLAVAIMGSIAVIDVDTVILDGAFPTHVRAMIVERTREALKLVPSQGVSPFSVIEGSIGNAARAMGGAAIPLLANFTQDREVLFKEKTGNIR